MFLKFIKFGIVGFVGLIIDFSITFLLKEKLNVHRYIANSIGFITAASSNYFFNRIWTFYSKNPKIALEYTSYILISAVGLIINNTFLFLFEKKFKLHFYISKFMAIIVTTLWNFIANYYITFNMQY